MWEAIKKYDKRWYILLLAVFIAVVAILFRNNEMNEKEQGSVLTAERMVQEAAEKQKEKVQSKTIVVDIKGAVVRPGVYEITDTARVNDVVGMAGGFTKEADQTKVNLAAKVHDEMMIYVPARGKRTFLPQMLRLFLQVILRKFTLIQHRKKKYCSFRGLVQRKRRLLLPIVKNTAHLKKWKIC